MTTYYVRKSGNDTTGDGSSGNPWLTLSKAYSVAGASDTVLVGDGLYQESTSGGGFWSIVKNPASWLTLEGENGRESRVGIMGASHSAYNTLIQGASYLRFNYLRFLMRISTNSTAIRISASADHLEFNYVDFWGLLDAVTYSYAMQINPSDGSTVDGVTYNYCNWKISAAEATKRHVGLQLTYANLTGICRNITLNQCTAEGSRIGVENNGATGVVINGGEYSATGSAAIMTGFDGSSGGKVSTTTLQNGVVAWSRGSGHAVLFGHGSTSCLAEDLRVPEAYDYAVVVKENTGTEVRWSNLVGGLYSALYCKAAVSPNLHHNKLQASAGLTTGVFQVGVGDTGNKCQNVTFRYNHLVGLGNVNLIKWADSSGDAGGGVCDYNTYELRGTGTLGNVRSTTGITTLAGLQAAWSGYDVANNDTNSELAVSMKLAGRFARVLFDGYDLSGWGRQIEAQVGMGSAEVTGFGEGGENEAPAFWQFSATLQAVMDAASGASHAALKSPGSYAEKILMILLGANATPTVGDEMIAAAVTQFGINHGLATKNALALDGRFAGQEHRPDLGLVQGYSTITATTNFASINNGLASSSGGVGYLEITAPVLADSYVVKLQHSTDDATWADLITFTLNGQSRGAERIAVSGTVNAYTRLIATRTGSAGESLGIAGGFARY